MNSISIKVPTVFDDDDGGIVAVDVKAKLDVTNTTTIKFDGDDVVMFSLTHQKSGATKRVNFGWLENNLPKPSLKKVKTALKATLEADVDDDDDDDDEE